PTGSSCCSAGSSRSRSDGRQPFAAARQPSETTRSVLAGYRSSSDAGRTGSPLQSAPAVGAGPVGEGRDARGAPRALERADVGLVVDGEVTVAALAVRAQLEHAGKRRTAEPRPPDPAPPTPARSAGEIGR